MTRNMPQASDNAGMAGAFGRVKRALDWPQVWFLLALALTGLSTTLLNLQNHPLAGALLGAAGAAIFFGAAMQMRRAQTTLNPRGQPARLVTGGFFAVSRNPIYLGNVVMILGLSLWLGAPLGVLVAGGFVWLVTERFIRGEEARLSSSFGPEFERWAGHVRRWI